MLVREVMTPSVKHVDINSTVRGAAQVMKQESVGCVPVMNGVHLTGIITDRDIVIRAIALGADPDKAKVSETMSEGVVTCQEDDDVEEAARSMKARKIRRIVVLSRGDSQPIGVLSLGDISSPAHRPIAGEVLEHVTS